MRVARTNSIATASKQQVGTPLQVDSMEKT